jgi:NADPH-dependent glutamate synthase beta subunit-like oxidoreductase
MVPFEISPLNNYKITILFFQRLFNVFGTGQLITVVATRQGVFAAGDVVSGPGTVAVAMREAKKVAAGIASYIEAKKLLSE